MSALARLPLFHRFFFAPVIDEMSARRIRNFGEDELGARGLMRWDRLHMTLAITDDLDMPYQSVIDALLRAGDRIAAAPFELTLGQLVATAGSVALRPDGGLPALGSFQQQIARAMALEGVPLRENWRCNPHVTLAYREGLPCHRPIPAMRIPVTAFALVHSFVGLTRHETLGTWALRAAPDAAGEAQYSLF